MSLQAKVKTTGHHSQYDGIKTKESPEPPIQKEAIRDEWLGYLTHHKAEVKPANVEWTQTHGFFLIMGGFAYQDQLGTVNVLTVERLEQLYHGNVIEWPSVTSERLWDHSKADTLAKFIAIGQTTWFCIQIFVRLKTNLIVTELEISTLAFAVLNLIMYGLWWNKPFDVKTPIVIPGIYSPALSLKHTITSTPMSQKFPMGHQAAALTPGTMGGQSQFYYCQIPDL
ncbi:hypothetical protein BJ165DRAFT_1409430 [Panaeolus papilionaceus]|nr:hypothetical protein BJ165DRAFT_1409430 [Panaeolus papilionaceus]